VVVKTRLNEVFLISEELCYMVVVELMLGVLHKLGVFTVQFGSVLSLKVIRTER